MLSTESDATGQLTTENANRHEGAIAHQEPSHDALPAECTEVTTVTTLRGIVPLNPPAIAFTTHDALDREQADVLRMIDHDHITDTNAPASNANPPFAVRQAGQHRIAGDGDPEPGEGGHPRIMPGGPDAASGTPD